MFSHMIDCRNVLYSEEKRNIFTRGIHDTEQREHAEKFGHLLAVILRAFSSSQRVNVEAFGNICKDLYLHLRRNLAWVSITPTIHKLLAHSAELIHINGGRGLKSISEEGLESNNKRLREFRSKLSRKFNQKVNLIDCLARLWIGSDPIVVQERLKGRPSCKICNESGHSSQKCSSKPKNVTNDDFVVNSIFI